MTQLTHSAGPAMVRSMELNLVLSWTMRPGPPGRRTLCRSGSGGSARPSAGCHGAFAAESVVSKSRQPSSPAASSASCAGVSRSTCV